MIEIYSRDGCSFCVRAAELCTSKGMIEGKDFVVLKDWTKEELTARCPHPPRTVPQIFKDGQYVGGYADLVKAL